jgi:hypothetical protein
MTIEDLNQTVAALNQMLATIAASNPEDIKNTAYSSSATAAAAKAYSSLVVFVAYTNPAFPAGSVPFSGAESVPPPFAPLAIPKSKEAAYLAAAQDAKDRAYKLSNSIQRQSNVDFVAEFEAKTDL